MTKPASIALFLTIAAATAALADQTSVTTVRKTSAPSTIQVKNAAVYQGQVSKTRTHHVAPVQDEKVIPSKLDANIGGTGNVGSMSPQASPGQ